MTVAGPGELTAFQSLMQGWAALAPYNGIHVMRLPFRPEVERWKSAITAATAELDLTDVRLEQPAVDIGTHLNAELNRPFEKNSAPLRFFVIDNNGDEHWLGVTFDHWLADDFSSRALLHRIFTFGTGKIDIAGYFPLHRSSTSPPRRGFLNEWLAFARESMRMRRACRIPTRAILDFEARTFSISCPHDALEHSRRVAAENGATLHDVFLAAAFYAIGASITWTTGGKRDAVAIVSPMDIRRFEGEPARSSFGLRLGQYIAMERQPQAVGHPELVRRIAVQTRRMKLAPRTELFAPTLSFWRRTRSVRARATSFLRGAPMAACITNVNLTDSWIEKAGIPEFRRVGPTGPAIPLLFAVTTLNSRISVDVTYRTASFDTIDAEAIAGKCAERLSGATTLCPAEHSRLA